MRLTLRYNRTLSSPRSNISGSCLYISTESGRLSGKKGLALIRAMCLSGVRFSSGIALPRTMTRLPPDPNKSYPTFWVSSEDTASYTREKGSLVISLITAMRDGVSEFLSRTCVAPRDFRYSAFLREAVVMIGEKPDNLAN